MINSKIDTFGWPKTFYSTNLSPFSWKFDWKKGTKASMEIWLIKLWQFPQKSVMYYYTKYDIRDPTSFVSEFPEQS